MLSQEMIIPNETIASRIYLIRGEKVMLDRDLAKLFGVETKQLKRQVRRNIERFPLSFMFELTTQEDENIRSQIGTLKKGRHSKYPPFAFTEHGILMLSSVLNSNKAIKMSVHIIETFVQLRKLANNYEEIVTKIQQMDSKCNKQFGEIYKVLQQLLEKPRENERQRIGYKK